jgi:hypothetical protein
MGDDAPFPGPEEATPNVLSPDVDPLNASLYTPADTVPPTVEGCTIKHEAENADNGEHSSDVLSRWGFALFLVMFLVFAALVITLVTLDQPLVIAVGVPAALSAVALGVLTRLAILARRRRG